jgi:hypothetical protein
LLNLCSDTRKRQVGIQFPHCLPDCRYESRRIACCTNLEGHPTDAAEFLQPGQVICWFKFVAQAQVSCVSDNPDDFYLGGFVGCKSETFAYRILAGGNEPG